MKKIIFLCTALLVFFLSARAQMERGMKNIGGTVSFQGTSNGGTTSNFIIEPSFNYFIADKFSIGGSIGFSSSKIDVSGSSTTTNSLSFGALARKHFTLGETAAFYLQGALNFGFGSNPAADFNSIGLGISPGILVFVTPKIGLEAAIGSLRYQVTTQKPDSGPNTTTSSYGIGLNTIPIYFGFRYYFN